MDMQRNGSNVWPYVIVGSAIGGAIGYLLVSESGRKIRHAITHPDELATNAEHAGNFVEHKARLVSDQFHGILSKARRSIEEGQLAYRDAGQRYRLRARQLEVKNTEIASNVHDTVDRMTRTAATVEQSVLDPICEIGALYRGVEQGIRALFGKSEEHRVEQDPIPILDQRVVGS